MATAYTSLLGLALPVTGELQGTWGTTVNDAITSLLDTAIAGTTTLSTDADVTLSTTTGAANQARQAILLCSGARTAQRTITAPAQSKIYTLINATTGGFSVKLVGAGPTTGITVVPGESALVAWNGTDFFKVSNTGGTTTFTTVNTTNLEVTNIKAKDGTASATIADTTGAFSVSAAFAANGNATIGDASADVVTVNGTSTFTAKPTVQLTSAATNTVTQAMRLDSQSSGTPAAGIGVGLEFAAETAAGNTEVGATLEAITTDVTAASEDFDLSVKLMINGAAAAEVARFKSTGLSLATGDTYQINNTDVLSATTLGSGVTGSSLTSVGTIASGTWQGAVISSTYGGTGINNGGRTLTINTNSGTLAFGAASKTLTINNSLTLAGTDATTMTFPAASTTVAGLGTTQTFTGVNTFTPAARTSGVASYFTLTTPADTGQTASTESIGASFTAATRTWATGALTLQRERVFAAPTYAFAGASTLTTAVNVDIAAPVAGANATITNAYALRAAATQFTGAINATGLTASQAIFTDANKNFVSNAITGTGSVVMSASPTLTGTITAAGATFSGAITMSATTDNIALGTSQTSGTWTAGGASQTGTITLDQSTKAHTLNIGTGATENATTKTINIGTAGVSGSTTNLTYGSGVTGSTTTHVWNSGGTEGMRLTSTGLGIGASPLVKFDVKGATDTHVGITASGIDEAIILAYDDGGVRTPNLSYAAASHKFLIASDEKMRLDSSGNLGLGVTPSAWGGGTYAIDIGSGSAVWNPGSVTQTQILTNAYNNGTNFIFKGTGSASRYRMTGGQHEWYSSTASGTAGNAISFTQSMTLAASGCLQMSTGADLGAGNIGLAAGKYLGYSSTAYMTPEDNVSGARIVTPGIIRFDAGGTTERARITSGGDLLVGTTSNTINANGFIAQSDGVTKVTSTGDPLWVNRRSSTGTLVNFYNDSVLKGTISTDGTNVAYNTSSDYRLKDNPQPLTNSGAFIDALQPKTWEWKTDGSRGVGFIAHEVQAVSPNTVVGEKDAVDADGKPVMQAMEYGSAEFIANIIAELQSLRARVAALEAQP